MFSSTIDLLELIPTAEIDFNTSSEFISFEIDPTASYTDLERSLYESVSSSTEESKEKDKTSELVSFSSLQSESDVEASSSSKKKDITSIPSTDETFSSTIDLLELIPTAEIDFDASSKFISFEIDPTTSYTDLERSLYEFVSSSTEESKEKDKTSKLVSFSSLPSESDVEASSSSKKKDITPIPSTYETFSSTIDLLELIPTAEIDFDTSSKFIPFEIDPTTSYTDLERSLYEFVSSSTEESKEKDKTSELVSFSSLQSESDVEASSSSKKKDITSIPSTYETFSSTIDLLELIPTAEIDFDASSKFISFEIDPTTSYTDLERSLYEFVSSSTEESKEKDKTSKLVSFSSLPSESDVEASSSSKKKDITPIPSTDETFSSTIDLLKLIPTAEIDFDTSSKFIPFEIDPTTSYTDLERSLYEFVSSSTEESKEKDKTSKLVSFSSLPSESDVEASSSSKKKDITPIPSTYETFSSTIDLLELIPTAEIDFDTSSKFIPFEINPTTSYTDLERSLYEFVSSSTEESKEKDKTSELVSFSSLQSESDVEASSSSKKKDITSIPSTYETFSSTIDLLELIPTAEIDFDASSKFISFEIDPTTSYTDLERSLYEFVSSSTEESKEKDKTSKLVSFSSLPSESDVEASSSSKKKDITPIPSTYETFSSTIDLLELIPTAEIDFDTSSKFISFEIDPTTSYTDLERSLYEFVSSSTEESKEKGKTSELVSFSSLPSESDVEASSSSKKKDITSIPSTYETFSSTIDLLELIPTAEIDFDTSSKFIYSTLFDIEPTPSYQELERSLYDFVSSNIEELKGKDESSGVLSFSSLLSESNVEALSSSTEKDIISISSTDEVFSKASDLISTSAAEFSVSSRFIHSTSFDIEPTPSYQELEISLYTFVSSSIEELTVKDEISGLPSFSSLLSESDVEALSSNTEKDTVSISLTDEMFSSTLDLLELIPTTLTEFSVSSRFIHSTSFDIEPTPSYQELEISLYKFVPSSIEELTEKDESSGVLPFSSLLNESDVEALSSSTEKDIISISSTDAVFSKASDLISTSAAEFSVSSRFIHSTSFDIEPTPSYQELEISLYTFVSSSIEELTVKDESSGVPSFSSLLNESDVEALSSSTEKDIVSISLTDEMFSSILDLLELIPTTLTKFSVSSRFIHSTSFDIEPTPSYPKLERSLYDFVSSSIEELKGKDESSGVPSFSSFLNESDVEALSSSTEKDIISISSTDAVFSKASDLISTSAAEFSMSSRFIHSTSFDIEPTPSYQELEISLYTFVSSSIEELTVKDESSGVPSFSSLLNESDVEALSSSTEKDIVSISLTDEMFSSILDLLELIPTTLTKFSVSSRFIHSTSFDIEPTPSYPKLERSLYDFVSSSIEELKGKDESSGVPSFSSFLSESDVEALSSSSEKDIISISSTDEMFSSILDLLELIPTTSTEFSMSSRFIHSTSFDIEPTPSYPKLERSLYDFVSSSIEELTVKDESSGVLSFSSLLNESDVEALSSSTEKDIISISSTDEMFSSILDLLELIPTTSTEFSMSSRFIHSTSFDIEPTPSYPKLERSLYDFVSSSIEELTVKDESSGVLSFSSLLNESDVEALSSSTEKDIISISSTDEMFSSTIDILELIPTTSTEFSVSSRFIHSTSFDIEPTPSYQELERSLYTFVSSSIEELTVKDESSGLPSFSSLLSESDVEALSSSTEKDIISISSTDEMFSSTLDLLELIPTTLTKFSVSSRFIHSTSFDIEPTPSYPKLERSLYDFVSSSIEELTVKDESSGVPSFSSLLSESDVEALSSSTEKDIISISSTDEMFLSTLDLLELIPTTSTEFSMSSRFIHSISFDIEPTPSYQELEISLYTFVSSSIEELTVKDESSGVLSFSSLLNESDVEALSSSTEKDIISISSTDEMFSSTLDLLELIPTTLTEFSVSSRFIHFTSFDIEPTPSYQELERSLYTFVSSSIEELTVKDENSGELSFSSLLSESDVEALSSSTEKDIISISSTDEVFSKASDLISTSAAEFSVSSRFIHSTSFDIEPTPSYQELEISLYTFVSSSIEELTVKDESSGVPSFSSLLNESDVEALSSSTEKDIISISSTDEMFLSTLDLLELIPTTLTKFSVSSRFIHSTSFDIEPTPSYQELERSLYAFVSSSIEELTVKDESSGLPSFSSLLNESDVEALSSNTEKDTVSISLTDEMFSSTLDLLELMPTTSTEFSMSSRFIHSTSFDIEPTPSYKELEISLYTFVSSSIEELTVKDESSGVPSFSSLLNESDVEALSSSTEKDIISISSTDEMFLSTLDLLELIPTTLTEFSVSSRFIHSTSFDIEPTPSYQELERSLYAFVSSSIEELTVKDESSGLPSFSSLLSESDVEALSSNTEKDTVSISLTDEMFSSTLDLLELMPTTSTEFSMSSRFIHSTSFDIEPTPSYQELEISLYTFVSSSIEELTVKDESSGVPSFSSLLSESDVEALSSSTEKDIISISSTDEMFSSTIDLLELMPTTSTEFSVSSRFIHSTSFDIEPTPSYPKLERSLYDFVSSSIEELKGKDESSGVPLFSSFLSESDAEALSSSSEKDIISITSTDEMFLSTLDLLELMPTTSTEFSMSSRFIHSTSFDIEPTPSYQELEISLYKFVSSSIEELKGKDESSGVLSFSSLLNESDVEALSSSTEKDIISISSIDEMFLSSLDLLELMPTTSTEFSVSSRFIHSTSFDIEPTPSYKELEISLYTFVSSSIEELTVKDESSGVLSFSSLLSESDVEALSSSTEKDIISISSTDEMFSSTIDLLELIPTTSTEFSVSSRFIHSTSFDIEPTPSYQELERSLYTFVSSSIEELTVKDENSGELSFSSLLSESDVEALSSSTEKDIISISSTDAVFSKASDLISTSAAEFSMSSRFIHSTSFDIEPTPSYQELERSLYDFVSSSIEELKGKDESSGVLSFSSFLNKSDVEALSSSTEKDIISISSTDEMFLSTLDLLELIPTTLTEFSVSSRFIHSTSFDIEPTPSYQELERSLYKFVSSSIEELTVTDESSGVPSFSSFLNKSDVKALSSSTEKDIISITSTDEMFSSTFDLLELIPTTLTEFSMSSRFIHSTSFDIEPTPSYQELERSLYDFVSSSIEELTVKDESSGVLSFSSLLNESDVEALSSSTDKNIVPISLTDEMYSKASDLISTTVAEFSVSSRFIHSTSFDIEPTPSYPELKRSFYEFVPSSTEEFKGEDKINGVLSFSSLSSELDVDPLSLSEEKYITSISPIHEMFPSTSDIQFSSKSPSINSIIGSSSNIMFPSASVFQFKIPSSLTTVVGTPNYVVDNSLILSSQIPLTQGFSPTPSGFIHSTKGGITYLAPTLTVSRANTDVYSLFFISDSTYITSRLTESYLDSFDHESITEILTTLAITSSSMFLVKSDSLSMKSISGTVLSSSPNETLQESFSAKKSPAAELTHLLLQSVSPSYRVTDMLRSGSFSMSNFHTDSTMIDKPTSMIVNQSSSSLSETFEGHKFSSLSSLSQPRGAITTITTTTTTSSLIELQYLTRLVIRVGIGEYLQLINSTSEKRNELERGIVDVYVESLRNLGARQHIRQTSNPMAKVYLIITCHFSEQVYMIYSFFFVHL